MSRYRGPRFKKIRRLGALPGLTNKRPKAEKDLINQSRFVKKSQYRIRLEEKQKLRFHYGLTERQLLKYIRIAGKAKGSTGQVLLQLLEMRLDNILFRLGMALTIPAARQLVNHRHVLVNGHIVDIPSYRCKPLDIITAKDKQQSRTLIQNSLNSSPHAKIPNHLTLDLFQYKGIVNQIINSKWVGLKINELLIDPISYFSWRIRSSRGLWLTDIAHHHLAIVFLLIIAGHMYRTNFGIGHSIKDILDAHKLRGNDWSL
ncbi:40S ribosomal protein S4 [Orobanche hederae]